MIQTKKRTCPYSIQVPDEMYERFKDCQNIIYLDENVPDLILKISQDHINQKKDRLEL